MSEAASILAAASRPSRRRWLALVCVLSASTAPAAEAEWRHKATRGGVTLSANPLSRAARVAFYEARGFDTQSIQAYASACAFSFGLHNRGSSPIVTRLSDWHAVAGDRKVRLRLAETWEGEWEKAGVSQSARIAFRWAQFQTENAFEPGDWIMGMATLEAPLAGKFRIVARYRDKKGDHEIVLDKLACARD